MYGISIRSDVDTCFKRNYFVNHLQLKSPKSSRYESVSSVEVSGLQRLHGFLLRQQVFLGYIASLKDAAKAKKS